MKFVFKLVNGAANINFEAEKITRKEVLDWLEKQGEQKPNYCHHEIDLSGCSEEYRKAYYDGWNNCNQQHAQLETQQKPAWSEEDERMIDTIIYDLERHGGKEDSSYSAEINWLKSLKPNNWKPSRGQMKSLKKSFEIIDGFDKENLRSLYCALEHFF